MLKNVRHNLILKDEFGEFDLKYPCWFKSESTLGGVIWFQCDE